MSAKIYVNFPQGQFSRQLTQSNLTHSDLQQCVKYQSSRGHPQELQVIKVLVAKFTETDLHYITVIMCYYHVLKFIASSQNCGGLMKHYAFYRVIIQLKFSLL